MVELGNHQGRPPGCTSTIMATEASSSLLDHWMNREINLDFAEQSHETFNNGYRMSNEIYDGNASSSTTNRHPVNYPTGEPTLDELGFDSHLSFEKDMFELEGSTLNESLSQFSCNHETSFKDFSDKLSDQDTIQGFAGWGAPMDIDALKLEEVFQVEQSDLVQGPTLAELNSNHEPFFDLEFGYDFTKDFGQQNIQPDVGKNKSLLASAMSRSDQVIIPEVKITKPVGITASNTVTGENEMSKLSVEQVSKIPKIKIESDDKTNLTPVKKVQLTCTSTRAPTLAPASIIAARLAGRERKRSGLSISSISSLSSLSNDEGFASQAEEEEDEDSDDQVSSDEESYINHFSKTRTKSSSSDLNRPTTSGVVTKANKSKSGGRRKKYFWQYNIQSKGPKVCIPSQVLPGTALDPHVLDDALDPVFSPECSLEGVKHSGKARRGDGNDLTPYPRKLYNIGLELGSLNDMINDLTPVSDVPFNARPKSRKEKNKLASRACRLKKKAQHEANKLKLYGLQKEHRAMIALIPEVRQMLRELLHLDKEKKPDLKPSHFQEALNKLLAGKTYPQVAGNTAEFVNQVLEKVAAGDAQGGLNDL